MDLELPNCQIAKLPNCQIAKLPNGRRNVTDSKVFIRMSKDLHLKLKRIAMDRGITLSEICVNLIENGIGSADQRLKNQEIGREIGNHQRFLSTGWAKYIVAILRIENGMVDWLLVVDDKTGGDALLDWDRIGDEFEERVIARKLPEGEFVPNGMWIQIAQNQTLVWARDEAMGKLIAYKLEQWSRQLI